MDERDAFDTLFIIWAFLFQIVLLAHFGLRKWAFEHSIRYGWIVYALGIPSVIISIVLLAVSKSWSFWLGGFICLIWAIFGYRVDYVKKINWRSPILPSVFFPYVSLYLLTIMFYWWPLGLLDRGLWIVYAILFVISSILNVTSHKRPKNQIHPV